MTRRGFLGILVCGVLWPTASYAQRADRPHRVAILMTTQKDRVWHLAKALHDGLRALGYEEGRDVAYDHRFAEGRMEQLDALAAELVSAKPDVIVVGPNTSVVAAMRASKSVPIVGTVLNEPVASGFVNSFSHPGGNITGLSADVTAETWGLRVQLLKELNKDVARVAVLWNPEVLGMQSSWTATEDAAKRFGMALASYEVRNISALREAFVSIAGEGRADALLVFGDGLTYSRRHEIIEFANRIRLPDFYTWREMVEEGGLVSYGYNLADAYRRSAAFVDKILKGQAPGDLPIELPTKLELLVNMRTAKARGLVISSAFLARADEVID